MKIFKTFSDLKEWLSENTNVSFVPTMGALHKGHLSLVSAAKSSGNPVVVSIFVNPTQFGPDEDFSKYPRDTFSDTEALAQVGVDAIFFPSEAEIYPPHQPLRTFDLPSIFTELEGKFRPTHFQGVAQVLFQFFKNIRPKQVFFGQKDFQQTVLVRWLLENFFPDSKMTVCPIVREDSGLARSSRNEYLGTENREAASILFKSLKEAHRAFESGERNPRALEAIIHHRLNAEKAVTAIDYAEVRDAKTLEKIEEINAPAVAVLVAQVGSVRLLDNMIFDL